jgi:hypothetical protein
MFWGHWRVTLTVHTPIASQISPDLNPFSRVLGRGFFFVRPVPV